MAIKLKKDIVIPADTIFENIDDSETEDGNGNYQHIFGLTKNTSGFLIYRIDSLDKEIKDWFEDYE